MRNLPPTRLLSTELVARIGRLEWVARQVVEGYMAGRHRSPYHGFSSEFSEHRPYRRGDDLRRIDWKVWGRTERYYVKQFEEETNLVGTVLLDVSRSMAYPAGGGTVKGRGGASESETKHHYARVLAAVMLYLLIRQRDAAGLGLFAEKTLLELPASSRPSHLSQLLAACERGLPASDNTRVDLALHRAAERLPRRGLVVVISDFQDGDVEAIQGGLRHLRHRGHEVLLFRVLHPDEVNLQLDREVVLRDLESGETVTTHGIEAREAVRRWQEKRSKELGDMAGDVDAQLLNLVTDEPLDVALGAFLHRRRRLR